MSIYISLIGSVSLENPEDYSTPTVVEIDISLDN